MKNPDSNTLICLYCFDCLSKFFFNRLIFSDLRFDDTEEIGTQNSKQLKPDKQFDQEDANDDIEEYEESEADTDRDTEEDNEGEL